MRLYVFYIGGYFEILIMMMDASETIELCLEHMNMYVWNDTWKLVLL